MRQLARHLLTVLLLATAAGAKSAPPPPGPPTFPDPGQTSMSKENQQAMGMEVAHQVYLKMPVLPDDSPETQYVRQLGQKLVATIPQQYTWPYEFHVIPESDINAFALPGGQMFVNIGVITAAKNEAELAGVMGHEMAHVYMQHSAKQASKAQTTSMIAGIASALLGGKIGDKGGGLVRDLGQIGIEMGAQGLMMKYSRSDESQADAVGAVILYQAGYNPQAMVDFFKTMGEQSGKAPSRLFASHPDPGNRQQAIAQQIAGWPVASYAENSPAFDEVRAHAQQVRAYTAKEIQAGADSGQWAALNQRNGAGLGQKSAGESTFPTRAAAAAPAAAISLQSILPNGKMVQADLGPMKIQRPENWPVVLPEQRGQFVKIAAEAADTGNGLAYGVLLNGTGAPKQPMSIDDMTARLIQLIQERNELQKVSEPQAISVGGVEGRSTLLRSASPLPDASGQRQAERDWLVTVPRRDGSLIFMIFVAPEADFAQLQPTYESMVSSVRFP
jgi:Zn-dependent protease with chaperone function